MGWDELGQVGWSEWCRAEQNRTDQKKTEQNRISSTVLGERYQKLYVIRVSERKERMEQLKYVQR